MKLVGLRKTSLVDYPGRLASVLFFRGCNMRCPYCHNAQLVDQTSAAEGLLELGEALDFILRRKGKIEAVVLTGGEPLIHPELPAIAGYLAQEGFLVKLDTNGLLPRALESIGADYYAIDLKTSPDRYQELGYGGGDAESRLRASLAHIRASGKPYEVRVVSMPRYFDHASARSIAALLEPGDAVKVSQFRNESTLEEWCSAVQPYTREAAASVTLALRERSAAVELRGFA